MASLTPRQFKSKSGRLYTLRSANLSDAAGILHYMRLSSRESGQFYETSPEEFNQFTEEQELNYIKLHLEHPYSLMVVAEFEGQIIGCLTFDNGQRQRSSHAGVLGISLAQAHHRQGLGKVMMEILIEWARSTDKIEKLNLQVDTKNEKAIELYKSLGFEVEATFKNQLKIAPGHYTDTLAMGLWLIQEP